MARPSSGTNRVRSAAGRASFAWRRTAASSASTQRGSSVKGSPASTEVYSMKQAPREGSACLPRRRTGIAAGTDDGVGVGDIALPPAEGMPTPRGGRSGAVAPRPGRTTGRPTRSAGTVEQAEPLEHAHQVEPAGPGQPRHVAPPAAGNRGHPPEGPGDPGPRLLGQSGVHRGELLAGQVRQARPGRTPEVRRRHGGHGGGDARGGARRGGGGPAPPPRG